MSARATHPEINSKVSWIRGSQKIQWKIMLYSKLECRSLVITQAPQFFEYNVMQTLYTFCITTKEYLVSLEGSFPGGTEVKNPPANAGDTGDTGSIPGSGRSPGEGHGNPLQYSCLENPMDRESWWSTAHRVAKSQTRLKQLSTYALHRYLQSL